MHIFCVSKSFLLPHQISSPQSFFISGLSLLLSGVVFWVESVGVGFCFADSFHRSGTTPHPHLPPLSFRIKCLSRGKGEGKEEGERRKMWGGGEGGEKATITLFTLTPLWHWIKAGTVPHPLKPKSLSLSRYMIPRDVSGQNKPSNIPRTHSVLGEQVKGYGVGFFRTVHWGDMCGTHCSRTYVQGRDPTK